MKIDTYFIIACEMVIGILSVFGNTLVILAVWRRRQLQTVTNMFIVSLGVADLLVGLMAIPFAIAADLGYPRHSFYGCLFVNSMVVVLTQSSIFSLLAIGIERYTAICHPFVYQRWATNRIVMVIIACTWLAALMIGLIPLMGWNKHPSDTSECHFMEVVDMTYMVYFNFFVCVLPPLIILLVIYAYIFYVVWKQTQRITALEVHNNTGEPNTQKSTVSKNLKAAKSLSSVVGMFALCWLPIHILNSIFVICGPKVCGYPVALLEFAILLSHANSMINPVIYCFSNSGFKQAFRLILCCGRVDKTGNLSTKGQQASAAMATATVLGVRSNNGVVQSNNGVVQSNNGVVPCNNQNQNGRPQYENTAYSCNN